MKREQLYAANGKGGGRGDVTGNGDGWGGWGDGWGGNGDGYSDGDGWGGRGNGDGVSESCPNWEWTLAVAEEDEA